MKFKKRKCLNRTITTVIFLSVSWRHISLISYLRWISGISWTERFHYRNRMLYPCQTSFRCCTYGIKKDFTKEQLKETIAYQAMTRIGILYKVEELRIIHRKNGIRNVRNSRVQWWMSCLNGCIRWKIL